MEWIFVASSQRLGSIEIESRAIPGRKFTITPTGDWIPEEDEWVTEHEYRVWCSASQQFVYKISVFRQSPTLRQAEAKPQE